MTAPIPLPDAPAGDDDYSHAIAAMRRAAAEHECARCGEPGYGLVSVDDRVVYLCRTCLGAVAVWSSARIREQARVIRERPDLAEMIARLAREQGE